MPTSSSIYYSLSYFERSELRAGICSDWPALLSHIERVYPLLDLEASWVASLSPESAEELRTAIHSRVAPDYTVHAFPVEDAFSLCHESQIRSVLRERKIRTQRLSTVLQTEGDQCDEWRARNRYLRQAKYWRAYQKDASNSHREHERALQKIDDFISGLQAHAEAIYVDQRIEINQSLGTLSPSQQDSFQVYALATTAVGVARLSTYIEAHKDRMIVQFMHPRGGFSFLSGSSSIATPTRVFHIQDVAAHFRKYPVLLAPHITAGLEAILCRLCAYPQAPAALREEAAAFQTGFWDRLSGDRASGELFSDPPPEDLS